MLITPSVRRITNVVDTTCSYCALQCGIQVTRDGETGEPLAVRPRRASPGNGGIICAKGLACVEELRHPDRLLTPLIRRAGTLAPGSWEEALDLTASRLEAIRTLHGNDAVAVYAGGCLTNEKSYLIGKWARLALGTRMIDYNGRYCMSSAAAAQNKAFGIDRGLPFPLTDLELATGIILCGTNLGEAQPPIMHRLRRARKNGTRIIVVDPRQTPTTRLADLHLKIRPGTDLALMNGLLHLCFREGWVDRAFMARHTVGAEAVEEAVAAWVPDRVAELTGLSLEEIETAARWFGTTARGMILTARGVEQHAKGVDTVLSHINLVLATGQIGRPGTGFGSITGQANGQGGREHGLKADQLPGYRSIENPAHRQAIAGVWGCPEEAIPGKGLSAYELLEAVDRQDVRALVVLGSNPLVSAPNLTLVERGLRNLEFLVVIDFFPSETAQLADVVLPGNMWAEEEGTVTNLEGRVILRRQVTAPPPGVRRDTEILQDLAHRLGAGRYFRFESVQQIFAEFRTATKGGVADYFGITYQRLQEEDNLFWPCPSEGEPGLQRLFQDGRFDHADGRARMHAVDHRPAAEEPDQSYPYFLTTGRVTHQYQSGNQTRRLDQLHKRFPQPLVEMHPALAVAHGLATGDRVWVKTRRGQMLLGVKLSPGIRQDTLFVPFHWGGALGVNQLVNPALDPVSRMPEFKLCAAALEKE